MDDVEMETSQATARDTEIIKIFKILDIIIGELGSVQSAVITASLAQFKFDLDLSDELSGFLMTVYTCLRKEINDKPGHLRFLNYTAKVFGVDVSVKAIVDKVKGGNIALDFLVATPIVELLTLFRCFFDEVRTGVTKFRVRDSVAKRGQKRDRSGAVLPRRDGEENKQNISDYGLTNQHICLLQGITLPPERRTGVIKSLGPMCQALLLVMEDKYFDKPKRALENSLKMLPMRNEIITALKEATNPGSVSGVLKTLGDLLALMTARSTQKIYFPLLLARSMWDNKGDHGWSFSGSAMIKYYTDFVTSKNVSFIMKSGGDILFTSEVVFHAMFGTYMDNLGLLEAITNKGKWHQRHELNSVFVKRGTKSKVSFTPVVFKYVTKMAQALLTKTGGSAEPQLIGRPSFTGFRKRNISSEFMAYLTTGKSAHNYSSEPTQLQYALKKTIDDIKQSKEKLETAGTTKWETKDENGSWVPSDFIAQESNIYFFG